MSRTPEEYENEISELKEEIERLRQLVMTPSDISIDVVVANPPYSSFLSKEMVEVPGKKYSIGKYQVRQALWESVMGYNPSDFKGSSRPVENVSWMDCVLFCNKLSEKEDLEKVYTLPEGVEQALNNQTDEEDENVDELSNDVSQNLESNGYRLPTEWEWWFAAKANQDFEYSGSDDIDEVAWYDENSNEETHGVGQKKPNGVLACPGTDYHLFR